MTATDPRAATDGSGAGDVRGAADVLHGDVRLVDVDKHERESITDQLAAVSTFLQLMPEAGNPGRYRV